LIALLTALIVFLLDRLTKSWAAAHLVLGHSVRVLPYLDWSLVENRGAAFGLLSGQTAAFIVAAALAVGALLWILRQRLPYAAQLGIGGVLGGAVGNLYDRVLSQRVVDFIDVRLWPYVFNVADIGITLGVITLVVVLWRQN